jgi:Zn-dependent protease with chaperone function
MNAQMMNAQAVGAAMVCPNGHGAMPGPARFCNRCGSQLVAWPVPVQPPQAAPQFNHQPYAVCNVCSGDGARLDPKLAVCPQCRWLRPLAPGYRLDPAAFQWAQDGQAMATLRSIGPLNSAAKALTNVAGRKWVETTFNGVRLSERQMPEVYAQAVKAARLLGLSRMPDIYLSGERSWDALTFGSDDNAFIVLGAALLMNFQGDDLLFLLAREMGHIRAGHALWKTVIRFLVGEQGPRRGMMAGGVLAMLNPQKLIEGALEAPLMAWARQAEITADRAGLLAVGDEAIARRVLLSWSLKSALLYPRINVAAWLEQQEDDGLDEATKLSEMVSSSTPYITRRLKLMSAFAQSPELNRWRAFLRQFVPSALPKAQPAPVGARQSAPAKTDDAIRIVCSSCQTGLRIPREVLRDKASLSVRCPNPQCGKVSLLKLQRPPVPAESANNDE